MRRGRKAASVVGLLLLGLVVVLLINTLRMKAVALPTPPTPPNDVASDRAAEHLATAVRLKTVSHENPVEDDAKALDDLRAFFEQTYPKVHASLTREIVGEHSYLYTWKGSDPSLAPVLFAAHQDVVPVELGSESSWTHAPFGGEIADGFVWGRGAIDDKGALVSIFEAAEMMLAAGFQPKRTILFAFLRRSQIAEGRSRTRPRDRRAREHRRPEDRDPLVRRAISKGFALAVSPRSAARPRCTSRSRNARRAPSSSSRG